MKAENIIKLIFFVNKERNEAKRETRHLYVGPSEVVVEYECVNG